MPFVRRTPIRGVVVFTLALIGCQGESSRTQNPQTEPRVETPKVAETPPLAPVVVKPPGPDHFVPPFVAKPRLLKSIPVRTLSWDMGIVRPGAKLEHRFEFVNDTDVSWSVKFVTPDCKCAVGEFTSRTIKPKEKSYLQVTFRADAREGPTLGTIGVDFHEIEAPRFALYVRGEVRKPFSAVPDRVDFGKLGPADQTQRVFELRNYTDKDIAMPLLVVPDWVRAEAKLAEKKADNDRSRQTWVVELHAEPGKLKNRADPGAVIVKVEGQDDVVTVPLLLKMKAPLEPLPGEIVFDDFRPGQATERTLLLELYPELGSLTEKDFALSHDLGDEFTAVVAKKLGTHRVQLALRYEPKAAYTSIEGTLTVTVRGKDTRPALVKISGTGAK